MQDLELLVYLDGFTKHSDGSAVATTLDGAGPSAGWQALVALANRAVVVVTEEMPVSPEAQWLKVGPVFLTSQKLLLTKLRHSNGLKA